MKKVICFIIGAVILLALIGCAKGVILHCDYCNKEVKVKESSGMTEDWIIYCEKCNEELFKDDPLLSGK